MGGCLCTLSWATFYYLEFLEGLYSLSCNILWYFYCFCFLSQIPNINNMLFICVLILALSSAVYTYISFFYSVDSCVNYQLWCLEILKLGIFNYILYNIWDIFKLYLCLALSNIFTLWIMQNPSGIMNWFSYSVN